VTKFKAKVEWRDPADLTPYDHNAKYHPDDQIEAIARLIREYGFDQPILIDEDDVVLKGHGRRLAALKIGLKNVPVIVRNGLTVQEKVAVRIADNRVSESGWDREFLSHELEYLKNQDFDMSVTGFGEFEIEQLLVPPGNHDSNDAWEGMPEFKNEDKTAFKTIIMHFHTQEAVDAFATLVGQKITDKTKYLWYPDAEQKNHTDKEYVSE